MKLLRFSRFSRIASAIAALAFVALLTQAQAATKKSDKKEEAAKPSLVASFGDWNVFVGQAGKGRICYTLAQPKTREPSTLKRDPGYAFISDRPAEGVRNEVSFIMGFDVSAGTEAEAKTDTKSDVKPDAKPEKPSAKQAKVASKTKAKSIDGPVAEVDQADFDLLPKGANLWVKNAARESELITEMKKGSTLEVRAASLKGNASTDSYSLSGFSQAMERLQKECPPRP